MPRREATPPVKEMERLLQEQWPDVELFPLVRTLRGAATELAVSPRTLWRSLRDPRKTLWFRHHKIYIPLDIYQRWQDARAREDIVERLRNS